MTTRRIRSPAQRTTTAPAAGVDLATWKLQLPEGEGEKPAPGPSRANVRRWAAENGYEVALRAYPAVDREGSELPVTKADPLALGVVFERGRS